MLNKDVGSFTFSWELIINENLLRGLISRLYLDIVAGDNNNNNNNNNKTYIAPISIRLFSSALKNVKLETI